MADLVYELLSQIVKNTNITINLTAKSPVTAAQEPKNELPSASAELPSASHQESGLVRADLVQLISDLERVSATLKRINKNVVGYKCMEVFFMLQNFDKILNSIKMVINAV